MSDTTYRVGVIGCGRKGTEHARAYVLNPRSEIVAAADSDPENLSLFGERFGVPTYSDFREMIRSEAIDIVSAVLPVSANYEVVMACAGLGVKAICTEKPLASKLSDADAMVDECRRRGIKFGCGDLERNHEAYWRAKQIIDSGELGALRSISYYQGGGTQLSGGGCQNFSLMRLFAGDVDVDFVIGWLTDDPWSEYDQGGSGYVRFVNGVEAFSHIRDTGRRGFELLCERGIIFSDNQFITMWKASPDENHPTARSLEQVDGVFSNAEGLHSDFGTIDDEGWERPGGRQRNTIQSMIDALDEDIEPRGNGDNGRNVLEMAIGWRESHRQGHVPVKLPLVDRRLRLFPVPGRMYNKKEVMGRDWYNKEMGRYKRA